MGKQFGISVTMGTLHFGLMFVALEHIEVGTAALLIQTSVPFALLLALIVFRQEQRDLLLNPLKMSREVHDDAIKGQGKGVGFGIGLWVVSLIFLLAAV